MCTKIEMASARVGPWTRERSKAINGSVSMIALIALVCQALSAADTVYPKASECWCPLDGSGKRWGQVARLDTAAGDHKDDRLGCLDRLGSSDNLWQRGLPCLNVFWYSVKPSVAWPVC
jgi:hypothetical protein